MASIKRNESRFDSIMAKPASQRDRYDLQLMETYLTAINLNKPNYTRDSALLAVVERYFDDSTRVLAVKYNAVFAIKNPLLNNARQEIARTFYLTSDSSKVLAVE